MRLLTFSILTFFLFNACHKNNCRSLGDYSAGLQTDGKATATRNGAPWECTAFGSKGGNIPDAFSLSLLTYYPSIPLVAESMGFDNIPLNTGTYTLSALNPPLFNNSASSYTPRTEDTAVAYYAPAKTGINWIKIASVDTLNHEILVRGSFNVTYKLEKQYENDCYPQRVRFKDGHFEVIVR